MTAATEQTLYWAARGLIGGVQALPLTWVARLGRLFGGIAYRLDRRHRNVAAKNMQWALADQLDSKEIPGLVREHFRRLGESYLCAIKTAAMSNAELEPYVSCTIPESVREAMDRPSVRNVIFALGHFGNFELYSRMAHFFPGHRGMTTYRRLRGKRLDALLLRLRQRSDCDFFERKHESAQVKAALEQGGRILGLLADQNGGFTGRRVAFFGKECSTGAGPAVLAKRYDAPLFTAVCYRTGLARWSFEVGEEIPLRNAGEWRETDEILADVNRALEAFIRKDPANWFWVHNRWKR